MLGVAIRIAQRMGLDSESTCSKLLPFEAEMSRRIWWSLMLFDSRVSELAGHKSSILSPTWDCKVPLNVNDSDIRPGMKEPPALQGKTTESLFSVVRSELGDFVRQTMFHLEFTCPALKPIIDDDQRSRPPDRDTLATLEKTIEAKYINFCNPENPLHFMAIWMTRTYLAKCRLIEHHSTYSSSVAHQTESQYDTAMGYALKMLEYDTKISRSPLARGYIWFLDYFFPFMAYMHIVQDLKRRPVSKQAQRAWDVMSDHYEARFLGPCLNDSSHFALFAKTVIHAWDEYETKFKQLGKPLITPRIVSHIKGRLARGATGVPISNMQQHGVDADMSIPSLPLPFTFEVTGMSSDLSDQDDFSGGVLYPDIMEQMPLDSGMRQLNWAAMEWGLEER